MLATARPSCLTSQTSRTKPIKCVNTGDAVMYVLYSRYPTLLVHSQQIFFVCATAARHSLGSEMTIMIKLETPLQKTYRNILSCRLI